MKRMSVLTAAEQVAAQLRAELVAGRLVGVMPGVLKLEGELGVNRNTVEAALRLMEQDGLLERQGAGRRRLILLARDAMEKRTLRIAILAGEPLALGRGYMIELLHLLQEDGHQAFFTTKCLKQLNMDVRRVARLVAETPADAWVLTSASGEVLRWFIDRGIPAFALFGRRRELPVASAGPDKVRACREVVRELVALGHRRIVMLVRKARRSPRPGAPERAFLEELEAQGIPTSPYNLPDWEESSDGVHELLDSLFRVTPPTALIIDEAYLFHAVKYHLSHRGLEVPGDVSLVCTDPDLTFAWCRPTIAHIAWDPGPLVRRIVRWAANVSHGRKDLRQMNPPAQFVTGGTVGRVKIEPGNRNGTTDGHRFTRIINEL